MAVHILLEGTTDDVLKWSETRPNARISCRELLKGASSQIAHDYAQAALDIVHRAIKEALSEHVRESTASYLVFTLHHAAVTAPASGWARIDDDARHAVALEVAQQLRVATATFFGKDIRLLIAPVGSGEHDFDQFSISTLTRVLRFVSGLVDADLAEEQEGTELIGKLKRLQGGFGLTQVELAELLHVEPQAIRKWLRGGGATPENRAAIDVHLEELRRLESHFKPGLLPSILRRPDRGLKGRRPIKLVVTGKANQFADYVERVIADDRTA